MIVQLRRLLVVLHLQLRSPRGLDSLLSHKRQSPYSTGSDSRPSCRAGLSFRAGKRRRQLLSEYQRLKHLPVWRLQLKTFHRATSCWWISRKIRTLEMWNKALNLWEFIITSLRRESVSSKASFQVPLSKIFTVEVVKAGIAKYRPLGSKLIRQREGELLKSLLFGPQGQDWSCFPVDKDQSLMVPSQLLDAYK